MGLIVPCEKIEVKTKIYKVSPIYYNGFDQFLILMRFGYFDTQNEALFK